MFSLKHIWGRMTLLSLLAVLYFSSLAYSQEWAAYYGWFELAEVANYAEQTSDGGYILVGYTQSKATVPYGGDEDIYLIKTDRDGGELWSRTFGDDDEQEGYVVHETTDEEGTPSGYIILSHSEAGGVDEFLLIKTDSDGIEEWRNTYGDDYVQKYGNVKQTADGGYILVGTRSEGSNGTQVYMVKTDANGDLSWDRSYGGDYQDRGRDIIETSDGGYMAVGTLHLIGGDMNIYLVKTNSSGELIWGKNFGTAQEDYGEWIQKRDDGYLIFGHTSNGSDQNPYIVKTDMDGNVVESKIISDFEASGVTQTTDGGYAFSSMCQDSTEDPEFPCIIKMDNSFTEQWRWSWEAEDATNYFLPTIQQTIDQGFILAGTAYVPDPSSSYRSRYMAYLLYYDPDDANTPPSVPILEQPADDAEVISLTPGLTVINSTDPDGQPLTYYFEVYIDEALIYMDTSADVEEGAGETTTWQIAEALDDHKHYWWRCRAYDGLFYSDWMEPAHFKVNTANEAPGIPTRDAPENGSNVSVLQPTLTVINAWNGDEDVVTYEFEVYADEEMTTLAASATNVVEGDSTTSWQVDVELDGDSWYWWRVQARDDENLASGWSALHRFFIDMGGEAPGGLSIVSPEDNSIVASLDVTLEINNATDPQGDAITYDIQLNDVNIFDSIVLMEVFDLEEGAGGTTSWPLPEELLDNTPYYWRIRPCDSMACGDWVYSSFFVNVENDAPTTPRISSPVDGSEVNSTTPTLTVVAATDIDGDMLTYTFEVYADEAMTSLVVSASGEEGISWQIPSSLDNYTTYYWRVCAIDEHGMQGPWMDMARFTVHAPPGAPQINSPLDGGVVFEAQPTLSVQNGVAIGNGELFYAFEIYANEGPMNPVEYSDWLEEGEGFTSWQVLGALENNESYYWRARARDGAEHSAWTDVARFLVILDNDDAGEKDIVGWGDVSAAAPDIEIVTVTDAGSALAGTSIEIPVGALAEDCTVIISEVNNPPALPDGVAGLGVPVDFGPDGLLFSQPVTIRIPYSQAQLDAAGVSDPRDLSVWTYNTSGGAWEEIAVDSVDTVNRVLVCSITHFSMYQIAAPVKASDSGGGGGSGGGCFIETVRADRTCFLLDWL